MNCYGLVNIINDLEKKNNKKVLILGFNGIILNFLETVMFYVSKQKKIKISFCTIKYIDKGTIMLQKWTFKNNKIKEDKC